MISKTLPPHQQSVQFGRALKDEEFVKLKTMVSQTPSLGDSVANTLNKDICAIVQAPEQKSAGSQSLVKGIINLFRNKELLLTVPEVVQDELRIQWNVLKMKLNKSTDSNVSIQWVLFPNEEVAKTWCGQNSDSGLRFGTDVLYIRKK